MVDFTIDPPPPEPTPLEPLQAAQQLAEAILRTLSSHAARYHDQAPGEVHMSVVDAKLLDEDARRTGSQSEYCTPSNVEDGSRFTIWGRPGRASSKLRPGHAFIGYYVEGPGIGYEG